jgi:Tol biopolymer transport system component
MSNSQPARDFFVAGGTLRSDSRSYVPRPADTELHRLAAAGKLCYVLTTRQMGKSSLMQRVGQQLRQQGVRTALVDLTSIGTATQDEWYLSLLDDLQSQLGLETDAETWWFEHTNLSPAKRLTKFLHEVILSEVAGPVVIFIDEVDSVLHLDFSDDFFAAIRAVYNQALTAAPDGQAWLAFVLLGVAAPNDLIRDRLRTPFNIGERIELEELALKDARAIFAQGLPQQDAALVERIFDWTAGHPYLTQKIGQAIARRASEKEQWSEADVDELVQQLFLTERARSEESNLQFVAGRITGSPQREQLLRLYREVLTGKKTIGSDERSAVQTELKLYGLVKRNEQGHLAVRNRIYQQAFDQSWVRQHLGDHRRRNLLLLLGLALVMLALLAGYFWWQAQQASNEILAQSYRVGFNQTENPTLRLDYLARLLALPGYEEEAVALFATLPAASQSVLFVNTTPDLQEQAEAVLAATYMTLVAGDPAEPAENTAVLAAMLAALRSFENIEHPTLPAEIESWLAGRTAALAGDYEAARLAYSVALSLNEDNPAVRYERALVALALGDNEAALADLTRLLDMGEAWRDRTEQVVIASPALHPLIAAGGGPFAGLLAATPTLTVAEVPTAEPTPAAPIPGHTPTPTAAGATGVITVSQSEFWPVLSSGGRLAFVSGQSLYVETAAGSGEWQMVTGEISGLSPAPWSPDGSQIAFLYNRPEEGLGLGIWDTAGQQIAPWEQLRGDSALELEASTVYRWSADGRYILFISTGDLSSAAVWVLDVSQPELFPVMRATNLDDGWWLDEETVLAQAHCEAPCQTFAAYNLTGELRWEVVNETSAAEAIAGMAALSPNRRRLVYLNQTVSPGIVESIDVATGERTVIWQLAAGEQFAGQPPSISPDGAYVSFNALAAGQAEGVGTLYLIGSDGSSYGRRDNSTFLDWRPAGGLVASQAIEGGQNQLVYWPLGGPAARIFVLPSDFTFPTGRWSPDGRSFVYSAVDEAISASYLYLWQPEGGLAALVHATASSEPFDNFAWTADSQSFYFSLTGVALWRYRLEPAELRQVVAAGGLP